MAWYPSALLFAIKFASYKHPWAKLNMPSRLSRWDIWLVWRYVLGQLLDLTNVPIPNHTAGPSGILHLGMQLSSVLDVVQRLCSARDIGCMTGPQPILTTTRSVLHLYTSCLSTKYCFKQARLRKGCKTFKQILSTSLHKQNVCYDIPHQTLR